MRALILLVLAAAAAAALAAGASAVRTDAKPVVVWKTKQFGKILATPGHLALYTWNKEKDKKVHCTGSCEKVWPAITVPSGATVAKHVAGAMGVFGTIKRRDGRTQVTFNGRPLYTYHQDSPTKILCNGVDGWFVVKA
jgi:predicted lipoprotein with Yx(FWY)xxD motif